MRAAFFLRNVPVLASLSDELLGQLAAQVTEVRGIGLLDWKALPLVRALGREAARRALAADPELIARLAG